MRITWLATAAAALTLATTAQAQPPAGDSVIGNLFDTSSEFGALVDARSGPSGENPTGAARFHLGGDLGPDWQLDVTCLSVTDHTAVVGFSGTLTTIISETSQPTAGLIRIVDGGAPASAQDSLAFASVEGENGGPPIPGPTSCATYPAGFPLPRGPVVNDQGDLVVTDSLPLPTSKEQCKNGGWRNYGVFKNQGDCVSFVATGGKNPPGRTG